MTTTAPAAQRGVTFVEAMIALAIAAILAALAAPSFLGVIDKHRLKGATDNLFADLQFARSEAIRQNTAVAVYFTAGSSWCYGITTASCDCTQSPSASNCEIKLVSGSDFRNTEITAATFGSAAYTTFEPVRGTATSGSVTFQSGQGRQGKVIVSTLGRIRLCSPSGTGNIPDYPAC